MCVEDPKSLSQQTMLTWLPLRILRALSKVLVDPEVSELKFPMWTGKRARKSPKSGLLYDVQCQPVITCDLEDGLVST